MAEDKKVEEIQKKLEEKQGGGDESLDNGDDNRQEVYKSYLITMIASLMIMITSFITYYYPMHRYSRIAVQIINNDESISLTGVKK